MTDDQNLEVLTAEEAIVLETYRGLDEKARQVVWRVLREIYAARREAAADG